MPLGIIGKKLGMTRIFDSEASSMIPVTVIDVTGNEFVQVKTEEKDGYRAVQVAYDDQKDQRMNKPDLGHYKKHGSSSKRFLQEFRFEDGEETPDFSAGHPGATLFQDGQWIEKIPRRTVRLVANDLSPGPRPPPPGRGEFLQ